MTRAATSDELNILRSDGLAARLFAIIDQPVTVYSCQVNQAFTTHDKIAQVTYDNASGTLANALPGMTVLVGSTPGAWDQGLTRVRKTWTASIAYLGEMSEIDWADNLYLTVIDEFSIWPRHLRVAADATAWMDYDIAYSNQHNSLNPVPCMGTDRVLKLTGASVSTQLSASSSWVIGSSISEYAWSIVRGSGASLANANTATPTLTATAAGRVLLQCVVTAANGKTATGYRNVYVYDAANPPTEITLESFSGSRERGGFEFSISLPTPPGFTARDYRKVVLFAEEQPQAIAPIAGAENVFAVGWMDEAECQVDDKNGLASLSVKGAHYWLDKITGYPAGIENTSGTPARWTQINGLTVDKMLWHLLYWRTTLPSCVDFFLTGDSRQASAFNAPTGSLWRQIKAIAEESILAAPICDPYSRLFASVDENYTPESDRSAIPVIQTLTRDDFQSVSFTHRPVSDISRVELSGIALLNNQGQALFSLSPGHVFSRFGAPLQKDRLLLSSQAQANELAGLVFGRESRAFDFDITLTGPNRLISLAPRQYLQLEIAAGDTPAGIAYSGRVIPREISIDHDPETGVLLTSLAAEPETFAAPNTNGDIPLNDENDSAWTPPPFIPPPLPPLPPLPGPLPNAAPRFAFLLTSLGLYYTETFDLDDPVWIGLNEGYSEGDYTDGFRFLDVNQDGRYYVATKRQVYSGVAGWPAYVIKSEASLLLELPVIPPYNTAYQIYALGCNPAASDEYAFLAGLQYPTSVGYFSLGNIAGTPVRTPMNYYAEIQGRITWGLGGILATYGTGIGFNSVVARFALNGLTEDYSANLGGTSNVFGHVRSIDGADRVLTLVSNGSTLLSRFLTADGETEESVTTRPLNAGAFDETGLKILAVDGTTAYQSTDGGQNWAALTFPLSNANNSVIQCMAGDAYVWAVRGNPAIEAPGVFFTPDFGTTFVEKIGNLIDLAGPSFSVAGLKVFP